MEMHQIRYFLAVSNTLNFTRAAEECNVTQPSLTRAIQKLEDELGGALFRRERSRTHLSELGHTMLPLLQRSYESAMAAKEQAESLGKAEIARLRLGLSRTIRLDLVMPALGEIAKTLPGLELQPVRGTANEIEQMLEQGNLELAITASDECKWQRIDRWPLFTEDFFVLAGKKDALSSKKKISLEALSDKPLIWRSHCEQSQSVGELFSKVKRSAEINHEICVDEDLYGLVAEGLGVSIVPKSLGPDGKTIVSLPLEDAEVKRSVALLAVAGRRYSTPGQLLINLLRSADWSQWES